MAAQTRSTHALSALCSASASQPEAPTRSKRAWTALLQLAGRPAGPFARLRAWPRSSASQPDAAELVEAGVDGAVASDALSGLTICGAPVGAAVFGVSARDGAESVEAGVDGVVAIGSPSGLIICEATGMAAELGGAGVNAGAADSKPEEARLGASTSAFPPAGTEPLFAGAVVASGRASKAPACKGAACWLSCISERESLEGLRVCSFCDPTSPLVAASESSRSGRFGALFMRAKLTQTAAAPASASPPASVSSVGNRAWSTFEGQSAVQSSCRRSP